MDRPLPPPAPRRRLLRIAAAVVLLPLIVVLAVAILPLGWLRAPAEKALSARLGRAVTVGSVARLDAFSFAPRIAIRDVRIAQPAWVGRGDMIRLRAATLRLPLLPALFGRIRPREIILEGLRAAFVHDAAGRANWEGEAHRHHATGPLPDIRSLHDARFTLHDLRGRLRFAATAAFDPHGVRIDARGTHRGRPATLTLVGDPIRVTTPWRFRARFASPLAQVALRAVADGPLDFAHFAAAAEASGRDIVYIDDLVQAGLPGTQPVRLTAQVRHDRTRWALTGVRGRIGRSDLAGRLTVDRANGRTRLDGVIDSPGFDFDDLATDAQIARAAAKQQRIGDRVVPDTRIDLATLGNLDGRIAITVRRVLSRRHTAIRAASGTAVLDRSRLEVAPLRLALAHGTLAGRLVVDQRGHGPVVSVDLALAGARIEDYLTGHRAAGPLRGRIRLRGPGTTIRAAMARSGGEVALLAQNGTVERAVAEVVGRNAGAALGTMLGDHDARVPLRCAGIRLRATRGILHPARFEFDLGVASGYGRGTVDLDGERIALVLDGRARRPGLAKLPSPIEVGGTLSTPAITIANGSPGSAKTILKTVGSVFKRLIDGKRDAPAPSFDCARLARQVGL